MKKKKRENNVNKLLLSLICFYTVLSIFMIIIGDLEIIKLSKDISSNTGVLFYIITLIITGTIILIGSVSGLIGLINKNINTLLFAIVIMIFGQFLFVITDSYYSLLYKIMNPFSYIINVLAFLSGFSLLILGYQKQVKNV